jgi:hypothetical protein
MPGHADTRTPALDAVQKSLRVAAETVNMDAVDPFRDRKASDTESAFGAPPIGMTMLN